ncbi:MAG: PmoA family protein [Pirellulales bacterium]|nr:PmoA family protein [Pirellulales bacterium]
MLLRQFCLPIHLLIILQGAPLAGADDHTAIGQAAANRLKATSDPQGVLIECDGEPVLFYQRATKSLGGRWPRANYVHPLYGLDGQVLTEDFPEDHRHHRGIFWAWHQVWVGDRKIGDPWLCRDFQWDVVDLGTSSAARSLSLDVETHWKSPHYLGSDGERLPIVSERAKITVHDDTADSRRIDFDISLLALVDDVRIGGSEDAKGYGGFSPRLELTDDLRFVGPQGEVQPIKTALDLGGWVNLAGPDHGVVMLSHPGNPGVFGRWILRGKGSMQNAVYPGRDPVGLSKQQPVVLRYRLIIHRGRLTNQQIAQFHRDYGQGLD